MIKIILRTLLGIGVATLVLGTPPAYAIFGIRAARTVIAARKAKKMASSTDKADAPAETRSTGPAAQENQDLLQD